jgi:cell wall-associated NlpC family hydrolase
MSMLLFFSFFQSAIAQETPIKLTGPSFQAPQYLSLCEKIKAIVENHLGVRYRRGGSSQKGVDCSGFAKLVYSNVYGIDLPHMAARQYSLPIFKNINLGDLRIGDLIFFSPTTRKKRINHVGIYLVDRHFAHAIEKRGVIISSLHNRHWKSRFSSAKRLDKLALQGIKPALHTRVITNNNTEPVSKRPISVNLCVRLK